MLNKMEILSYPTMFQYIVEGKSTALTRLPPDDLQRVIMLAIYSQNDGIFRLHNMHIGENMSTARLLQLPKYELHSWFNRMFRRRVLQRTGDDIGMYRGLMEPDRTIEDKKDAHYFYLRRNLLTSMCNITHDNGIGIKIFLHVLPCINPDTQILYRLNSSGEQTDTILTIEDLLKVVRFKHDFYKMSELLHVVATMTAACEDGTVDCLFDFESSSLSRSVRWGFINSHTSDGWIADLDFRTYSNGSWERSLIDSKEIIRICRSPIVVNPKVYKVKEG